MIYRKKKCVNIAKTYRNSTRTRDLGNPYEFQDISVYKDTYRKARIGSGRRHRRSYTSHMHYLLKFDKFEGSGVNIFIRGYDTKAKAEAKADEIRAAFKRGGDKIEIDK